MDLVDLQLLHGSAVHGITALDLKRARDESPFGPAAYLTDDADVAGCYTGSDGLIYRVRVRGDAGGVLDLDRAFDQQSNLVKRAVLSLTGQAGRSGEGCVDVRDLIDGPLQVLGKRERNARLVSMGVWLIRGHVSPMEHGGRCDRGVQFAVLSAMNLEMLPALT